MASSEESFHQVDSQKPCPTKYQNLRHACQPKRLMRSTTSFGTRPYTAGISANREK